MSKLNAMTNDEERVADLLRTLQERAKELTCLYRVDELLNQPDVPLDDILRAIAGVLPPGWQYPHMCRCRIVFEGRIIQPQPFEPTRWVQSADIAVRGLPAGTVEVYYLHQAPHCRRRAVPQGRAQADRHGRGTDRLGDHETPPEERLPRVADRVAGPDGRRRRASGARCWTSCATPTPRCCCASPAR